MELSLHQGAQKSMGSSVHKICETIVSLLIRSYFSMGDWANVTRRVTFASLPITVWQSLYRQSVNFGYEEVIFFRAFEDRLRNSKS